MGPFFLPCVRKLYSSSKCIGRHHDDTFLDDFAGFPTYQSALNSLQNKKNDSISIDTIHWFNITGTFRM